MPDEPTVDPSVTPDVEPTTDPAITPDVTPDVEPTGGGDTNLFSMTDDDFNFEGDDGSDSGDGDITPSEGDEPQEGDYAFDLGENSGIPDFLHQGLGSIAQKAGIDASKASTFMREAMAHAKAEDQRLMKEDAAKLKEELGDKFEPTIKATKSFMARAAKKAGLNAQDMALLASPRGIRLMNAIREQVSESSSIAGKGAPVMTNEQKIEAIMNDPEKFLALSDSTHPQHSNVNAELNRLYGIN